MVTLSTTKADYVSSIEAFKEAIWLKALVSDFGIGQEKVIIHYDNQSAIYLTKNLMFHEKTKHIDYKMHFAREKVEKGRIKVTEIHINFDPVDILIEPVDLEKFRSALSLVNVKSFDSESSSS